MWLTSLAMAASVEHAVALRSQGQLGAAVEELETVTARDPAPAAWIELAVTRSWTGDLAGAQEAYQNALALAPDALPAAVGEARVLAWRGRRARAEQKLARLTGDEAQLELARVQVARRRLRAARETLAGAGPSEAVDEVRRQLRESRRTRLTLAGAYVPNGASRLGLAASHEISGALTLRAEGRVGRDLTDPLASSAWIVRLGATYTGRGLWLTPALHWEAGPWAHLDAAVRTGPCVPAASLTARLDATAARAQAGLRCEVGPLAGSVRAFASVGERFDGALALEAGNTGRWQVLTRAVGLSGGAGGALTLGGRFETGPVGVGAELSYGTGVLAGPSLAGSFRFSF